MVRLCRSEMVRLYRFHRLQLRTHVINFPLRLQLFENSVIDYKLQITIIIETFSGGKYARLLLIGSGFEAALCFDFILNVLRFSHVIRDEVEWWQQNKQKIFCRTIPKYASRIVFSKVRITPHKLGCSLVTLSSDNGEHTDSKQTNAAYLL